MSRDPSTAAATAAQECSPRREPWVVSTNLQERGERLLLRGDQLAVLDFDVAHVIRQLQAVALFR